MFIHKIKTSGRLHELNVIEAVRNNEENDESFKTEIRNCNQ